MFALSHRDLAFGPTARSAFTFTIDKAKPQSYIRVEQESMKSLQKLRRVRIAGNLPAMIRQREIL